MSAAKEDLQTASRKCISHGTILAIKYVVSDLFESEVNLNQELAANLAFTSDLRAWLQRTIAATMELMTEVLSVLSMDEDAYMGTPIRLIHPPFIIQLLHAYSRHLLQTDVHSSCLLACQPSP